MMSEKYSYEIIDDGQINIFEDNFLFTEFYGIRNKDSVEFIIDVLNDLSDELDNQGNRIKELEEELYFSEEFLKTKQESKEYWREQVEKLKKENEKLKKEKEKVSKLCKGNYVVAEMLKKENENKESIIKYLEKENKMMKKVILTITDSLKSLNLKRS